VEGAESLIMADFPWDEYTFRFATIERPKADLRQMLEAHGYKYIRDLGGFGEALWVHPDSVLLSMDEIQAILKKSTGK
jgi:hypothetical protein